MPTHPAAPGGRSGAGAADRAGALTREHRRLLLVLLIPAFASLLAISSVNVILPVVGSSLRAGAEGLQWVVAGYTLVFGVLLVPAGRAGDLFGRGRLFVVGLVVFGIGSLASGLAPDVVWLNVARLVMGVGSGLFNPQASGMIVQYFDGAARGRAFGLFGAVLGVSVASGPVVGGALIGWLGQDWGWRASLLINVPFVVLGVIAALRLLPASAWAGRQGVRGRADLDPVGAGLLTLGVLLVMLPFAQSAGAAWVWLALPTGCAVLAGWVSWERRYRARGRDPMVDIGLFRQRAFGTGALIGTVFFLGYAPVWLILAQYLQAGLGATALETGLVNIGPLKNKGVVKGDVVEFSEKPLASIPFRKINWALTKEKKLHDEITELVREYQESKNRKVIDKININLEKLGVKINL